MHAVKWVCNQEREFVVDIFHKIDFLQLITDASPCYDPGKDEIRVIARATEPALGRNSFLPVVDARFKKSGNMTYLSMEFLPRKSRYIFDVILSSFLVLLQIIILATLLIRGFSKQINIIGLSFETAFMPIFMLIGIRLWFRCGDQIFFELVQKMISKQFREKGIVIQEVSDLDK